MKDCPSCRNSGVDGGGEPCERCDGRGWVQEGVERHAASFREFRRLWAEYRTALAQPFALDRDQDEQIKAEVERCYENLNNLAKEG